MNWFKILKLILLSLVISFHMAQAMEISIDPSLEEPGKLGSIKLRSQNLFMRNVEHGDLDYFFKMFANPIAMEKYMQGIPRPAQEVCGRHQKYLGWWNSGNPFTSYITYLHGEAARTFLEDQERLLHAFNARLESFSAEEIPLGNEIRGLSLLLASFRKEFEDSGKIFIGHVLLEEGEDRGLKSDAEISYILLPAVWRRGYGKEAVENIVELSRTFLARGMTLNSHSIDTLIATARPDNPGSCGVLEKNGFMRDKEEAKFGAVRRLYTRRL